MKILFVTILTWTFLIWKVFGPMFRHNRTTKDFHGKDVRVGDIVRYYRGDGNYLVLSINILGWMKLSDWDSKCWFDYSEVILKQSNYKRYVGPKTPLETEIDNLYTMGYRK